MLNRKHNDYKTKKGSFSAKAPLCFSREVSQNISSIGWRETPRNEPLCVVWENSVDKIRIMKILMNRSRGRLRTTFVSLLLFFFALFHDLFSLSLLIEEAMFP